MTDLFSDYAPSVAGSATSEAAAEEIAPDAARLRARVYGYLQFVGSTGATDEEMQDALNMVGNTQRPRRTELVDAGKVRDSGLKRKTKANRGAVVWVVCK